MDLESAQAAEDAYRQHQKACRAGCDDQGASYVEGLGFPRRWRCEEGRGLWSTWQNHRPTYLPGERTLPNGDTAEDGVVEKVQTIGYIDFVEIRRDMSKSRMGVKKWKLHGTIRRDLYVDRKSEWIGVDNVEIALLLAIAIKHGEAMSGAAYFAGRVLGLTDEEMGEKK